MRKIVRSLTCPSEYSIEWIPISIPPSLSLSLSPSLHRRKSAATGSNDSEPRSVTHSSERGPERDISCVYPVDQARPAINQRKANRFQLMHRYRSLVAAEETWKCLEFSYRIVPSPLGFTRRGWVGVGRWKSISRRNTDVFLAYWVRFFFVRVIMWERMCGGGRKNGRGEQRNSRSNSRMEE